MDFAAFVERDQIEPGEEWSTRSGSQLCMEQETSAQEKENQIVNEKIHLTQPEHMQSRAECLISLECHFSIDPMETKALYLMSNVTRTFLERRVSFTIFPILHSGTFLFFFLVCPFAPFSFPPSKYTHSSLKLPSLFYYFLFLFIFPRYQPFTRLVLSVVSSTGVGHTHPFQLPYS